VQPSIDQDEQTARDRRDFGRELVIAVLIGVPLVLVVIFANERIGVDALWIQLTLVIAVVVIVAMRLTSRRSRERRARR